MTDLRICTKCGIEKPISEYFINGGYRRRACKECVREMWRSQERRNSQAKSSKKWRNAHPNWQSEYAKVDGRIVDDTGSYIPIDILEWNRKKVGGSRPSVDISGKTFHLLTATDFLGTDIKGQAWWRFRCKCGAVKDLKASTVKSGKTRSCGCVMRDDISGLRFGRLVAIENTFRQRPNRKSYLWRCICDCGKEIETDVSQLKSGNTQSCGCYAKDMASLANKTHGMSKTKEYNRAKAHQHREKYGGHEPKWTPPMERALSDLFRWCVVCGSRDNLQTDHVLPKSKGYVLEPGNAVKLCRFHNGSGFKGNKMIEELPEYARDQILSAAYDFSVYWGSINGEPS